jgi:hypothetical protein
MAFYRACMPCNDAGRYFFLSFWERAFTRQFIRDAALNVFLFEMAGGAWQALIDCLLIVGLLELPAD